MNMNLTDQEMMTDVLFNHKQMTGIYNTFANECTEEALRNDMLTILREEHNMQSTVFSEMQKRGWYTPAPAEQSTVNQANAKYKGIQTTL